jgi:hypothetical protein
MSRMPRLTIDTAPIAPRARRETPTIVPQYFSEAFLSAANPYLLQAEIAAAVLLGIGIIFESGRYPNSVHKVAFLCVVAGVVFETVFSILLFISEEHIASLQRTTIASLQTRLVIAEAHASDRLIFGDDVRYFFDLDHAGQALHIYVISGDFEAERFANSLRNVLSSYPGWGWHVTVSEFDKQEINMLSMPSGIWGPIWVGPNNGELQSVSYELYTVLFALGFCIYI